MPKIRKSAKPFAALEEPKFPHTDPVIQKIKEDLLAKVNPPEIVEDSPAKPELEPELALTKDEMNALQLQNALLRCYAAERELTTMKRDEFLKMVDPGGQLRNFAGVIQGLTAEHNMAQQTMGKLVESIKTRLGIDLKKYTYNEDSGILTKLEE